MRIKSKINKPFFLYL